MALMPALGKVNEISEPLLKYYFDGRISLIGMNKKELTQAGLEPTISCSVGRRLIHWATEPLNSATHFSYYKIKPLL